MERTGPGDEHEGATVTAVGAPATSSVPSFGHAAFSGHAGARLEPTGRLAIPATYKGVFAGQPARIRPFRGTYLMLWTERAFDLVANSMEAKGGLIDPLAKKAFYRSAPSVTVDRQGRLVIPPELREQVGMAEQVVVAGAIEALEIWPADTFERLAAPALADADLFLDTFTGLPTDPA